jgi:cell division protein FtsI (penicillin-binding protein 3)
MSARKLSIKHEIMRNLIGVFLVILVMAFSILYKMTTLMLNQQENNIILHAREDAVPAYRGNIYDENKEVLATSLPFYKAAVDLGVQSDDLFFRSIDTLSYCLSKFYNGAKSSWQIKQELLKARNAGDRYYELHDKLSYTEYLKMKSFPMFRENRNVGGFIAIEFFDRMRPFGEMARRTIGFTAEKTENFKGLELSYNDDLKGKDGLRAMRRVKEGKWLPVGEDNLMDPIPGRHLVTTLNVNYQEIVQNELLKALEKHEAGFGSVMLMDVRTGDVKAISSMSRCKDGVYREILNRNLEFGGDPGSTFKAASVLALLQDEKLNIHDTILTHKGKFVKYDIEITDGKIRPERMALKDALALSSNSSIAALIDKYYGERPGEFYDHLENFGLTNRTGLPIQDEVSPVIKHHQKDARQWYGNTLAMMAWGYEMTMAPAHILQFYNTIANDGMAMKPRLVKAILNEDLEIEQEFPPIIRKKRIAKIDAIKQLKQALEEVVLSGTASYDQIATVCSFAGKTGTVQLNYDSNNANEGLQHAGSFVGYFPAENPRFSLIVKVARPKKGGIYGAQLALPAFKRIMNLIMSNETQLMAQIDTLETENEIVDRNLAYQNGDPGDYHSLMSKLELKEEYLSKIFNQDLEDFHGNEIPDVRRLGLRDAVYVLENRGLKVVVKGSGKVKKQSISPGTLVNGQTIKITLG